jgi:hypothetical protein
VHRLNLIVWILPGRKICVACIILLVKIGHDRGLLLHAVSIAAAVIGALNALCFKANQRINGDNLCRHLVQ